MAVGVAILIICTDIFLHQLNKTKEGIYTKISPHLVLFFYGLLNLGTSAMMFYLKGSALETTNFMILCFGAASIMLSARYFAATLLLIIGTWLMIAKTMTLTPEIVHFGFALLATTALSIVIYYFRRNNQVLLAASRIKEQIHQKELLRSAKMVVLGEMASGIAHEINNPLMIIMGKADGLRKEIENPSRDKSKALEDIDRIERTVERISKIIKGLNIFSRKSDIDPKRNYRLLEIVDDTVGLCQQRLNQNNIRLHVDIDAKVKVHCRPPQISQVLLNLISNSIDAIQKSEDKWIRLAVRDMGDFIEFRVTDCGNKISADIQEKIMMPFFTTKELGHGTGLGLSISKTIIEDHGGNFYYDSESQNTCFVLTLPTSEKVLWSSKSTLDYH